MHKYLITCGLALLAIKFVALILTVLTSVAPIEVILSSKKN